MSLCLLVLIVLGPEPKKQCERFWFRGRVVHNIAPPLLAIGREIVTEPFGYEFFKIIWYQFRGRKATFLRGSSVAVNITEEPRYQASERLVASTKVALWLLLHVLKMASRCHGADEA